MPRSAKQARALWVGVIAAGIVALATTPSSAYYRRPGSLERDTVGVAGTEAIRLAANSCPEMAGPPSSDASGRYIAFASYDTNLVLGDANLASDVFLFDRKARLTELVSVSSTGTFASDSAAPATSAIVCPTLSAFASISADGRYVAFSSRAGNLVPGDTNQTWDVFVRDMKRGVTTRASVASDGSEAQPADDSAVPWDAIGGTSSLPALSVDGRYVAFQSKSPTLTNASASDSYTIEHDMKMKKTWLVSIGPDGKEMPSLGRPSISSNGRFVAFSYNNHVGLSYKNGNGAVIRFDNKTRKAGYIDSTRDGNPNGGMLPGRISERDMSADGRYVLFQQATDPNVDAGSIGRWVPADTAAPYQLYGYYVRDLATGRIMRIDVNSVGEPGRKTQPTEVWSGLNHQEAQMTPDGRYVVYGSVGANLSPEKDAPACGVSLDDLPVSPDDLPTALPPELAGAQCYDDVDVFVYDRMTGTNQRLSLKLDGSEGDCLVASGISCRSIYPSISAQGRYASFWSDIPDLVDDDTNLIEDLFVADRGDDLGVGDLTAASSNTDPDGICILDMCVPPCILDICPAPSLAAATVDRDSDVGQSLTEKGANLYGSTLAYRPSLGDMFVRIELQAMPAVAGSMTGDAGVLYGFDFTVSGTDYEVRVQHVPGPDYSRAGGASFALFRKDPVTGLYAEKIATLRGGYGTTGEEVVFSLPLNEIGLERGGKLTNVEAFSALGSYLTGPAKILDKVTLR